jgi:hypothetical protein
LQAGGRRFDPVILHHSFLSPIILINTKEDSQESSLLLAYIDKSIGCSLTIHRVDISAVSGNLLLLSIQDRAANSFLIASITNSTAEKSASVFW